MADVSDVEFEEATEMKTQLIQKKSVLSQKSEGDDAQHLAPNSDGDAHIAAPINEETVAKVFKRCGALAIDGGMSQYGYSSDPKVACWAISDSIRRLQSFASLLQGKSAVAPLANSSQRPWPPGHPSAAEQPPLNEETIAKVFKQCLSEARSKGTLTQYGYSDDVACYKIVDAIGYFDRNIWLLERSSVIAQKSDGSQYPPGHPFASSDDTPTPPVNAETLAVVFKTCKSYGRAGEISEYGYNDDPKHACWVLSNSIRQMATTWRRR